MITRLEWDTNFFGFGIARLENNMDEPRLKEEINQLKKEGIKLVYCFCRDSDDCFEKYGQLVDKKVTYYKLLENDILPTVYSIEEYNEKEPTEQLYDLAIQSGIYSRFNVDKAFSNDKFVELYKTWIRNSTRKQIAFKVLVAKEDENIVGMITLGEKEGRGDIGLLAVDSQYRGKSIGRSLVNAAQNEFKNLFNDCQVVTQNDNSAACTLYESSGYTKEKTEHIYHVWL